MPNEFENVSRNHCYSRLRAKRERTLIARELKLTEIPLARARRCAPPHARGTVVWVPGDAKGTDGERPTGWMLVASGSSGTFVSNVKLKTDFCIFLYPGAIIKLGPEKNCLKFVVKVKKS